MLTTLKATNELSKLMQTIINKQTNANELLLESLKFIINNSLYAAKDIDLNSIYYYIENNETNKTIFEAFINSICLNVFAEIDNKLNIYQINGAKYAGRLTYYEHFEEPYAEDRKGLYYLFPMEFFDYIFTNNGAYRAFKTILNKYKISLPEMNDIKRVIVEWTVSNDSFDKLITFFDNHPYLKVAAVMMVLNNTYEYKDFTIYSNRIKCYHEGYLMIVLIKLIKSFGYNNVITLSKLLDNNVVIDDNYAELIEKRLQIVIEHDAKREVNNELNELLEELKINNEISFPSNFDKRHKNFYTIFNYLILANKKHDLNMLIFFNKLTNFSQFTLQREQLFLTVEAFKQLLSLNIYAKNEIEKMTDEFTCIDPQLRIWYNNIM